MTRLFNEDGATVPVTVIAAGACPVVQVTGSHVQLGFGVRKPKRTPKALLGHVRKAGLETTPHVLRSFPLAGEPPKPGEVVTVGIFTRTPDLKMPTVTTSPG